jgi:transposase
MLAAPFALPDLDVRESAALKTMLVSQRAESLSHKSGIEHLKMLIANRRRMQFGYMPEKIDRQIEQRELKLEDLEASFAEQEPQIISVPLLSKASSIVKRRGPLPEFLPCVIQTHVSEQQVSPDCSGVMKHLEEDVSEMLERIPAGFTVIRHVRPRLCCSICEAIVQALAPDRPIDGGLAPPGLLVHVLTAGFADRLPLCRQSEIYTREGVELAPSTLTKWVGQTSSLLNPLVEMLRRYVLTAGELLSGNMPVAVFAPGDGKTRTGRLCGNVRNEPKRERSRCRVQFGIYR